MGKSVQHTLGRLLTARTTEKMLQFAKDHQLTLDERIDLRGQKVRFNHEGLDLSQFVFEETEITKSLLTNCHGEGATFIRCRFLDVRITAERGRKVSFARARFDESRLKGVEMGPRTLDLSDASFRGCDLSNVTFAMGSLRRANFTNARLTDVYLRSAILEGASFRDANLTRVSFEKTPLVGVDFGGAALQQMEQWGEPDFTGAIISDEQRYQYGIVSNPVPTVDRLLSTGMFSHDEAEAVQAFRERIAAFAASSPRVMLIGGDYADVIPLPLFARIMKVLKQETIH